MSVDSFKFKSISYATVNKEDIEGILQSIVNTLGDILENFISANRFKEIGALFDSSESLPEILSNILTMTNVVKETMPVRNKKTRDPINESLMTVRDENYLNLEKIVQKHEAEIRNHIKVEQQLSIYAQGLEEQLASYTNEISKLKSDKSNLEYKLKNPTKNESISSMNCIKRQKAKSIDQVS